MYVPSSSLSEPGRTKRRPNGAGSIGLSTSGKWVSRFTLGYDENGKEIRRYLYGNSKEEVETKLQYFKIAFTLGKAVSEVELPELTPEDLDLVLEHLRWIMLRNQESHVVTTKQKGASIAHDTP